MILPKRTRPTARSHRLRDEEGRPNPELPTADDASTVIYTNAALAAESLALLAESISHDLAQAGIDTPRTQRFAQSRRELQTQMQSRANDGGAT